MRRVEESGEPERAVLYSLAPLSGQNSGLERAGDPFFMDRGAPKRTVKVLISQTQKKITEAGGIQNVGVKQRRHSVQDHFTLGHILGASMVAHLR